MSFRIGCLLIVATVLPISGQTRQAGERPTRRYSPLEVMTQLSERSGKGDAEFYRSYVDDAFVGTTVIGSKKIQYDKKYVVNNWGAKDPKAGTSTVSQSEVVLSGDTAVIRATIDDASRDDTGALVKVQTWVADVYVRRKGQWKLLSSMEVVVPSK